MTDELERRLMLQAIEEQFRPRPFRALARSLRQLGKSIKTLMIRQSAAKTAQSAA